MIREILNDGCWHPFSELFVDIGMKIPPEQAYRRAVAAKQWVHADDTVADIVRKGRKKVLFDTLANLCVVSRGERYKKEYRLPVEGDPHGRQCSICGVTYFSPTKAVTVCSSPHCKSVRAYEVFRSNNGGADSSAS